MSLAYLFNTGWMAACYPEARAYHRGTRNVRDVQAALLRRIVRRNRDTWFGRKHAFTSIRDEHDFQDAVPISTYDDYRPAIERIANGEQRVLTAEPVRLLEPTGGSTSGEKLIPYTAALRRSFQRAIRLWIWDLYVRRPAVRRGRSYWSITPLNNIGRRTTAGISIGYESDSQYLSRWEKSFVEQVTIAPPEIGNALSTAAAQYSTVFHLLRAQDLSLVSVWSPTFLIELFHVLDAYIDRLVSDVAIGRITFDAGEHGNVPIPRRNYKPLVDRAEELRSIFCSAQPASNRIRDIWPSLALVSCWADGPSLVHANHLRQYLADIELQHKGLLATEGFVTVPLLDCAAPALAIRSNFFEFVPATATSPTDGLRPLLANELVVGENYRVVLTTDGGLYRYQLHDEVEVAGFYNQAPLLRFVGKTDHISDIVGEKLHAAHVQSVLQRAFDELELRPTYSQLIARSGELPGYVLKLTASGIGDNPQLQSRLLEMIETGLVANPAYKYARVIGQLRPPQLELIGQKDADTITSAQTTQRISNGQRLGNIKPTTLKP
jgi:hypothetical protein